MKRQQKKFEVPDFWTFDDKKKSVAKNFDDHVRNSLPWYDLATDVIRIVARHYICDNALVYDVGASNGNFSRSISNIIEQRKCKVISIEKSKSMAESFTGIGEIVNIDAINFDFQQFDFALCYLVLMFMSYEDRQALLRKMISKMKPQGCLVILEKFNIPAGFPGTVFTRLCMSLKLEKGITFDQVAKKELSLSGVQRPLSRSEIPENAINFFTVGEFKGYMITHAEDVKRIAVPMKLVF